MSLTLIVAFLVFPFVTMDAMTALQVLVLTASATHDGVGPTYHTASLRHHPDNVCHIAMCKLHMLFVIWLCPSFK